MNGLIIAAIFIGAQDATLSRNYARSAALLDVCRPYVTAATYNQYNYLRAVVSHGTGKPADAKRFADLVLDSYPVAERRQQIIAEIILNDIATWKDGDLNDIDRLMKRNADDLSNGRTNPDLQKEIIDKLDRLIKEQESPPKPEPSNDPKPPEPQHESIPSDVIGKGQITEKVLKQLKESWGTLPEKEREKILKMMETQVPDKYREMIEQYRKQISK